MPKIAYAKIKRQCIKIKQMWADGFDDTTIKRELNLTESQWDTRIKYIAKDKFEDKALILYKYETKIQKRYDQLEALLCTTTQDQVKLACIKEMREIDSKCIETGQKLGLIPEEPQRLEGNIFSTNIDIDSIPDDFKEQVIKKTNEYIRQKYLIQKDQRTLKEIEGINKT